MSVNPLDSLPLWAVFVVSCLVVYGALEIGYRIGRWRHRHASDEKDSTVGVIVGSILGLLAFILAFTFSLAASRFEERRQTVLEEANAIGTAYLRTQLLPEPQRSNTASLLREYVDVRLKAASQSSTFEELANALAQSEQLHTSLWSNAMSAAEVQPTVLTGLFIQALNGVIDIHGKRVLIGVRSRIPTIIWIGLLGLAIIGMASTGYQTGLSGTRRSLAMFGLVVAFSGVFSLIADLDNSATGPLRTSQEAMIDVKRSMEFP